MRDERFEYPAHHSEGRHEQGVQATIGDNAESTEARPPRKNAAEGHITTEGGRSLKVSIFLAGTDLIQHPQGVSSNRARTRKWGE